MRQLTIRGLDEPLLQRLQQLARQEGLSLNKAALLLLKRGAGLDPSRQQTEEVGHLKYMGSDSTYVRSGLYFVSIEKGMNGVESRYWLGGSVYEEPF